MKTLLLLCLLTVAITPLPTAQASICTLGDISEDAIDAYAKCQAEQAKCHVLGWLRNPPRPPVCLD